MVNFNNETTVTRPRQDVVNFMILERRRDALDKLSEYIQTILQTDDENPNIDAQFRSKAYALAEEIRDMLNKEAPNAKDKNKQVIYDNADQIQQDIMYGNKDDLMKAFRFVNSLLYAKKLTQSDIKDITDPEEELYDEYDGD